jgi:hypothetical protein
VGPYVHFDLTRDWAREAGFGDVADLIALADVTVDAENPARRSFGNFTRHFAPWAYLWVWHHFRLAVRARSPESLGHALHSTQDAPSHGYLGLAHVRYNLGVARDPDDWDLAPERVRVRIRDRSLRLLRRYRASV